MRVSKVELSGLGPFEEAVFEVPAPVGPGELVLFEGENDSGKSALLQAIATALCWRRAQRQQAGAYLYSARTIHGLEDRPLLWQSNSCSESYPRLLVDLEGDGVRERLTFDEVSLLAVPPRIPLSPVDNTEWAASEARVRLQQALSYVIGYEVHLGGLMWDFRHFSDGLRGTVWWLHDLVGKLHQTWEDKTRSALDQDFWLFLDGVDEGLHPRLTLRLLPALRTLFPRARIYAATHSPFMVASAGYGYVFTIQTNHKSHRVSGPQAYLALEPGMPLERIVTTVFDSPSMFVDEVTRAHLETHETAIAALRKGNPPGDGFVQARTWLLARTEEVGAVVAMREAPVYAAIRALLRKTS